MSAISIANLDILILLDTVGTGGEESSGLGRAGRIRRIGRSVSQGLGRIFRPGGGGRRGESIREIIRSR